MIISCENCSTSFKLDDSLLKSTGSKVRCSNCKNIFLVYPPSLTETHDTQEDIGELSAGPHGEPEDHTSGDGSNRQFDGAALAQSGDLSTEQVQGDEALPEKLLDMDEDTIAQILKLDETPQNIPDADSLPLPQTGDGEMLDLPLDLDLDVKADAADATSGVEEIDLSELEQVLEADGALETDDGLISEDPPELMLDIDEEPELAAETAETDAEEIDLSELEQALEGLEEVSAEESDNDDRLDEADLELETALSDTGNLEEVTDSVTDENGEIDLSELEQAFGDVREPPTPGNSEVDLPEAVELDLETAAERLVADEEEPDLDEISETLSGEDDSDAIEDLSLDIEEEVVAETDVGAGQTEETGGQEEIDLSDIEQLLESDEGFAANVAETPEFTEEASDGTEEHIDVSEIEDVLSSQPEQADETVTDMAMDDLDLEFDIDEEPVAEDTTQETFFAEDTSDFEFEEEDVEIAEASVDHEELLEETLLETESLGIDQDLPLETDREGSFEVEAVADDVDFQEATIPEKPSVAVAAAGTVAGVAAASASAVHVRKKGGGRFLLVLLLILLLLIGGYAAYSIYPGKTIAGLPKLGELNIPYVSQFFQSRQPSDQGNLNIKTSNVTSRFLDSGKAGRLFVIGGKLKNEYLEQRSGIKIAGKLYVRGKKLVQTQIVSGGVFISDLALSRMNADQIKERLSQPGSPLKSGQTQPFMIVFSSLPQDLEEFTIEVLSSKK